MELVCALCRTESAAGGCDQPTVAYERSGTGSATMVAIVLRVSKSLRPSNKSGRSDSLDSLNPAGRRVEPSADVTRTSSTLHRPKSWYSMAQGQKSKRDGFADFEGNADELLQLSSEFLDFSAEFFVPGTMRLQLIEFHLKFRDRFDGEVVPTVGA